MAFETRRLFRTFGSLIIELDLNFKPYWEHDLDSIIVLDAVIRFCTSVKSLKLDSFHIPNQENIVIGIGKLFERLQKLHLRDVYFENDYNQIITKNIILVNFFNNCASLIKLKMNGCFYLYTAVFRNSFPILEHLIIEDPACCSTGIMNSFVLRHPNLKTFSLNCEQWLAENCISLQTLETYFPSKKSITSLAKFQNLRKLSCYDVGR